MKYSSLINRVGGSGSDSWGVHYDAMARHDAVEDVIILSVGEEADKFTPKPIVDAAIDSLKSGRHHYTPIAGTPELLSQIAKHHYDRTCHRVETHNCASFSGAQNALFSVAQCILKYGDEVILMEPYYIRIRLHFLLPGQPSSE